MIKAFLFDYDGVITNGVHDDELPNSLAHNLQIPVETASEWLREIWRPLLKGQITEDDVWRMLEAKYGQPIAENQRDIWFKWDELQPLPNMIALLDDLKTKGYPVGLLSNATPLTAAAIRRHGGYDPFDFTIISYEVGFKKPEPEIFAAALAKLPGLVPHDVLFLDDREPNIIAGTELGYQTILVRDHAAAIAQVRTLLDADESHD